MTLVKGVLSTGQVNVEATELEQQSKACNASCSLGDGSEPRQPAPKPSQQARFGMRVLAASC